MGKTEETGLNDAVRNAKDPKEVVVTIKKFEQLSKEHNKTIINIIAKRGFLDKKLKIGMVFLMGLAN